MRFDGLTAVITGAASGIGRAAAELLAERGAAVAILDCNAPQGEAVAHGIRQRRGEATFHKVDVSDAGQLEAAISAVCGWRSHIDALVYSAGIQRYGTALTTSEQLWKSVLDVNLNGAWHAARFCLPHMLEQRGSIVNVSSVQGLATQSNVCAYTVSKHALIGLTRSLAVDFALYGVRANAVCPGTVDTPMLRQAASLDPDPAAVIQTCEAMHPVGRIAEPREIAEVIAFLVHPSSSFVTGAVWTADGGLLTRIGGAPQIRGRN